MTMNHFGLPCPLKNDTKSNIPTIVEIGYLASIYNLFLNAKINSYKDLFKIKRAIFSFVNSHLKKYGYTYEKIAKTCKRNNCGLEYNFLKIVSKKIKIIHIFRKINILFRTSAKKLLPKKIVLRIKNRNKASATKKVHLNEAFPIEVLDSLSYLQSKIKKEHLKKFIKHENYKIKGQLTTDYFGTKMEPALYFSYYLSSNNLFEKIKSEGKQ
jgi:hypothetical protein